jgi:hypothetical protein
MRRLSVAIDDDAYRRLSDQAAIYRRAPRDQAGVLLEAAIAEAEVELRAAQPPQPDGSFAGKVWS